MNNKIKEKNNHEHDLLPVEEHQPQSDRSSSAVCSDVSVAVMLCDACEVRMALRRTQKREENKQP